jgi:hypothetical protein
MVKEKAAKRTGKSRRDTTDIQDRDRITEEALSAIRQTAPAAALAKCRVLADQINTELSESEPEQFVDTLMVAQLQAFLERAAAVLKKM